MTGKGSGHLWEGLGNLSVSLTATGCNVARCTFTYQGQDVFILKQEYGNDYPALVMELKWNRDVKTALQQIKEKKYPDSIRNYTGNILLIGIS